MKHLVVLLSLLLLACPGGGTLGDDDDVSGDDDDVVGDDDDATGDDDDSTSPCGDGIELTAGRVLTTGGVLEGTSFDGGWSWLGVPYVEPTLGDARFLPPPEISCAEDVVTAGSFGPKCPQPDEDGAVEGDEDCLHLNVWAPDGATQAPVLFFVHGGGNVAGSTTQGGDTYMLYGGAELAERFGVVVVTVNYRLGALGFLAHEALTAEQGQSGNYGLMDQQAALEWVQSNIGAFGGDPDRVLLFGESAGAVNTCMHVTSPGSEGLFSAAIMQSGSCGAASLQNAEATGAEHVDEVGCEDAEDVLACLRGLGASALAELSVSPVGGGLVTGGGFGPTVDGAVLVEPPLLRIEAGRHNAVPFVIGSNADETGIFTPVGTPTAAQYPTWVQATFGVLADAVLAEYPVTDYASARWAWIALTTDAQFVCPTRIIARTVAEAQTEPVWRYFFSRVPPGVAGNLYGAWHGLELGYVFGKVDAIVAETGWQAEVADHEIEDAMGRYWTNLALEGDVNGPDSKSGPPTWPQYDVDVDATLEIGDPITPVDGVRTDKCDFWEDLLL